MQIVDFERAHIRAAMALAQANYGEERRHVPALPEAAAPELAAFADNGLGSAAIENGELVGFLCCYKPWSNAFGTTGVKGVFSPIHAHGAVPESREIIYRRLYQHAAEKWVGQGVLSHTVALYAHDAQALRAFFVYGFGLRTVDAIRPMEEIGGEIRTGLTLRELAPEERANVLPLHNLLVDHLRQSPAFMAHRKYEREAFERQLSGEKSRYFAAFDGGQMLAYVKIMERGENFASCSAGMMNIQGAFCLPQYRGGVYQSLISHTIRALREEGFTRLGVDFESFNPTAYGFWLKHFTAYTNGVARRIDDLILG